MIKTITNNNFLNGHIVITLDDKLKKVTGEFTAYMMDEPIKFYAETTCHEEDTYNEKIGMDIVTAKIVHKYYAYRRTKARIETEKLSKRLKDMSNIFAHSDKKMKNIESFYENRGLDFC